MKKIALSILTVLVFIGYSFAQDRQSSVRRLIDESNHVKLLMDWSTTAQFTSGFGEYVKFFPIHITDLKTGEVSKAFHVEMYVNSDYSDKKVTKVAYISSKEVEDFVYFIEKYVIPNLDVTTEKKEKLFYKFNAKELSFSYNVQRKSRIIIINFIRSDGEYAFWTKTQVKKIPNLLEVLKKL